MDAQEQIFRLWRMLDDIDTLDDACRENDAAFRLLVRDIQRKRFDVLPGPEFDALWRVYGPNVGAKLPHAEQPAPERGNACRVGST